ncbi:MAG TPA: tetratricopeptide repeat protein, partial [Tepidisphaeraceae bacterium]|nr:tetratricopeptide repeat protein [Tepidisphaeraceae bacterium]
NESFLDSLGWVLYKRGKFTEARKYLEQAVGPAAFPDPVVLDHLADTLYRLSQNADATKLWQRSLKGIGEGEPDRDDLKQLRIQLIQKIKDAEANKPVEVAPTVEGTTSTAQAKQ